MKEKLAEWPGETAELRLVGAAGDGGSAALQPPELGTVLLAVWTSARDRALFLTDNRADADDVASEVMQAVMGMIEEDPWYLSDVTERDRFVTTAVTNRFKNQWRAKRRQKRRDRLVTIEVESHRSRWGNPQEELEERATRMAIHWAVDALPDRYREVWRLRHDEQKAPKEIAEELGIPASTVYGRLKRAFWVIRRAMEESEHQPRREKDDDTSSI